MPDARWRPRLPARGMGDRGLEPMVGVDTCVMMRRINCDPLVPKNGIPAPDFPMSFPTPFTEDERLESFSQRKVKAQLFRCSCCFLRETWVLPVGRQRFSARSAPRVCPRSYASVIPPEIPPRDYFRPNSLGSVGLRRWDMGYQERRLMDKATALPKPPVSKGGQRATGASHEPDAAPPYFRVLLVPMIFSSTQVSARTFYAVMQFICTCGLRACVRVTTPSNHSTAGPQQLMVARRP